MEEDIEVEDIDGCIESIRVKNFFCHDNLEVNLNRNVNFIVGRNGSGKSAILTALVVGLGGRASATNRGSNLNSFIKKGANSASVEIRIKNDSAQAYKPEVYGNHITIVRNINASGGSSYKVKSATGEIKSTKFEEVNAITIAHDIQVDNPISVLNQDDARSFHASDAKKKYALFRKATNLDQTEINYKRTLDNCKKARVVCDRKTEACIELEKEYKKWKTSHEQLQSRDEIEAKKQALQNEYYWSEVAELEKEMAGDQAQHDKQSDRVRKLEEKLGKMKQNYGCNTDAIDKLRSELDEKTLEKTSLEQELRGLEGEVREAQAAWRGAQHSFSKQQELLNRERRKVRDLEQAIHNIDSGGAASRRAELEERAERCRAAAAEMSARYDTARNDAAQARAHAAHAQQLLEQATQRAHRQRDAIRQLKQQLRELESRGNDSLAVYGNNMVELVQRVKQAVKRGEFSAPPRGPIGSFLKVKDKRWGGALEHILGGSVLSFCVNSAEDSRQLFQIMGQVYGRSPKPAVTCSKFLPRAHDTRASKVRARGFACALDAVVVSDPVIANYLIDNHAFETVLLVPGHDDAVRLSDTAENVPENCAKIVTQDSSEYYPAPNYRSYGGAGRQCRYLVLSTTERKKQVEAEIAEAELTLQSLEAEAEEASSAANEARQAERSAAQALQALMAKKHEKDEAARVAETALDQHHAPHHAVLVDELNVSKEKLQTLESQLADFNAKEERHKTWMDEYDVRIKKTKQKLAQATTTCRNYSDEIEQEQLKLDRGASERQTCEQKLAEDRQRLSRLDAVLAEKTAVVEQKTREALSLCARVDRPRDKAVVTSELRKTQQKLSSFRVDGLSKAQVAEKLLDVELKYRRATGKLARVRELVGEITNTTDKHLKFCYEVQKDIARKVQFCFQSILSIRGYSGSMSIDFDKSVLELSCSGRESSARRAGSTASLSGGERSYSTVAFIMALWECVELPFYFMDEFDVFMDNVNRKIVMDLLIDHALKNTGRQFVFLTPQDASSVTASQHISIHRMADPRP